LIVADDFGTAAKLNSIEEIIAWFRQLDGLTSLGRAVGKALLTVTVAPVAYRRWRSESGRLRRTF